MSGRDYELWTTVMALASWRTPTVPVGCCLTFKGTLRERIEASRDDAVPDADETILHTLAGMVQDNQFDVTCGALADAIKVADQATFGREWNGKRVANVLKRYGVRTRKER